MPPALKKVLVDLLSLFFPLFFSAFHLLFLFSYLLYYLVKCCFGSEDGDLSPWNDACLPLSFCLVSFRFCVFLCVCCVYVVCMLCIVSRSRLVRLGMFCFCGRWSCTVKLFLEG